jgi:hypothetical protein
LPSDPVLRLALIDAGVLTPDQLSAAEAKLAAAALSGGVVVAGRITEPGEEAERDTVRTRESLAEGESREGGRASASASRETKGTHQRAAESMAGTESRPGAPDEY